MLTLLNHPIEGDCVLCGSFCCTMFAAPEFDGLLCDDCARFTEDAEAVLALAATVDLTRLE